MGQSARFFFSYGERLGMEREKGQGDGSEHGEEYEYLYRFLVFGLSGGFGPCPLN